MQSVSFMRTKCLELHDNKKWIRNSLFKNYRGVMSSRFFSTRRLLLVIGLRALRIHEYQAMNRNVSKVTEPVLINYVEAQVGIEGKQNIK